MHVANLELCKELYELSGWDYATFWWFSDTPDNRILLSSALLDDTGTIKRRIAPAYDLGYLMRKLPAPTHLQRYVSSRFYSTRPEWGARLSTSLHKHTTKTADTPEDAACKLAIELFKQGVLTKEPSSLSERSRCSPV